MNLVRLIKTRLNETYSKVGIGKNLSDALQSNNEVDLEANAEETKYTSCLITRVQGKITIWW
jgi:hypothetical protein